MINPHELPMYNEQKVPIFLDDARTGFQSHIFANIRKSKLFLI